MMKTAQEALTLLKEGNKRFTSGKGTAFTPDENTFKELNKGQSPFAIVLGCSDSRVPVEIVFDQGLGEIFVIRVAGNIVAPSLIGSVEFAASQFGTPLCVVMGHSKCGAVSATYNAIQNPGSIPSQNLHSIVEQVSPSVVPLLETDLRNTPEKLIEHAIKANVRASVNHLRHGSKIIEDLVNEGSLMIVGAVYDLASGNVNFLDD